MDLASTRRCLDHLTSLKFIDRGLPQLIIVTTSPNATVGFRASLPNKWRRIRVSSLCHPFVRPPIVQIGAVRCHPPLSDNQLIFFLRKALLVDQVKPKTWRVARDTSLCSVPLMPPCEGKTSTRYTPKTRPPLVRSVANSSLDVGTFPRETELANTPPRAYQSELFRLVMESERNSLVYLPTGLGKTLVAAMVLQRLLQLNPERQAFFLVETNALAIQQVSTSEMF